MRILVTGATGFIGSHLCHQLVKDGHEVVALVRNPQKASLLPKENIHYLNGDLSLFKNQDLVLPPCDQVVHLAAIVAAAETLREYYQVNYQAVVDLTEALKRQSWQPKRLIFTSSLAAAGPSKEGRALTELESSAPNEDYGRSKLKAEEHLKTLTFPVTLVRPAVVYGPGDEAVLTLYKMAQRGLGFKTAGINVQFSFIYVNDLIDAIIRMIYAGQKGNKTYFVSHPDVATIEEMWEALSKVMQKKIRVIPLPRPLLYALMCGGTALSKIFSFKNQLDEKQYIQITTPAYVCSSQALTNDLQWQAQHNLFSSLQKTYEGYKELGWL